MWRISLSLLFVCFLTVGAQADTCLPDFVSLDVIETVKIGTARSFSHPLKSKNVSGIFVTRVVLEGKFNGQNLDLAVRFPADGVSLPYNVYLFLAGTEKEMLVWEDLTRGCTAHGISIFPGESASLQTIKPRPNAGTLNLHLILWGRL